VGCQQNRDLRSHVGGGVVVGRHRNSMVLARHCVFRTENESTHECEPSAGVPRLSG
jgi:hypothetical protein